MAHVGGELKRAREAAGLSLSEMAVRTKIAVTALEALERGDLQRLPGGIFGRSFVRAYALEVGIDPDATVERFIEELEQDEREAAARRAAARPEITEDDQRFMERQRRAFILLRVGLVALAVAIIALVSWQVGGMWSTTDAPAEHRPVETPAIVPPQPADPAPTPMSMTEAPASAVMVIELDVSADCWISMSVDGTSSVARLFRAGDHQRIEVAREILLDVGNAGGLRLTIDGRPARTLGRDGVHVRTRITRENAAEFLQSVQ